ncbi:MAG: SDR family oxidoreductase [Microcella sp.]|uniref:SDR family NAD(P)-dependent oxidoreductase n=1 Tax=Microcella sp. TaxID=1913979 RepID=UPI0033147900
MTVDYRGTTALITGASSGLGAEFARQLARRGANVVLVARRLDRLTQLAAELHEEHGITATPLEADLVEPGAVDRVVATVTERGLTISSLVNNAGFGTRGRFDEEDPARIHEEITLNVTALVDLTRALLPGLYSAGRGSLITVASTAAYQPVPYMAVYGATKAFVLSFTEALWVEAQGTGLRVLALSPGATRTEFFDIAGESARVGAFREPRDVVAAALRKLDGRNPGPSMIDGARNRATAISTRLMRRRGVAALTGRIMAPDQE